MCEVAEADKPQLMEAALVGVSKGLQYKGVILLKLDEQRPQETLHILLISQHPIGCLRRIASDDENTVVCACTGNPSAGCLIAVAVSAATPAAAWNEVLRAAAAAAVHTPCMLLATAAAAILHTALGSVTDPS